MSGTGNRKPTSHVALLPGSGMGHLTPFLRLAALLTSHNVQITFITTHPTVSLAESQALSRLFSTFPQINPKKLHLLQSGKPSADSEDPFYYHFELIRRSSHLLSPILSSVSPRLSAIITDMSLASTVIPVSKALSLPNYILFTSSAKMLTLFVSFHNIVGSEDTANSNVIKIPGLEPIPTSWIPPSLPQDNNSLLKTHFIENGKKIIESDGILVNTFEMFEKESLAALNSGKIVNGLPSVFAIGPFAPCEFDKRESLAWLDDQPTKSVMYVNFGSRTAMSREQIKELAEGLVKSDSRFMWVVKDKKVDREDTEELGEIIGEGLIEKVKEKGMVTKNWLHQEEILSHPAVGGFLSHCGWNSVTEAVRHGVPILAWPQHGDQKMNAGVVERIGTGTWVKSWGWGGTEVVKGEEIAKRVKEMMGNELLRQKAEYIREEARFALRDNGSSKKMLANLIEVWKNIGVK